MATGIRLFGDKEVIFANFAPGKTGSYLKLPFNPPLPEIITTDNNDSI